MFARFLRSGGAYPAEGGFALPHLAVALPKLCRLSDKVTFKCKNRQQRHEVRVYGWARRATSAFSSGSRRVIRTDCATRCGP